MTGLGAFANEIEGALPMTLRSGSLEVTRDDPMALSGPLSKRVTDKTHGLLGAAVHYVESLFPMTFRSC